MHDKASAKKRLSRLYRGLVRGLQRNQLRAYHEFLDRVPMRVHVEALPPRLMLSATFSSAGSFNDFAPLVASRHPAITMNPASAAPVSISTPENTSIVFSSQSAYSITLQGNWNQVELQAVDGTLTVGSKSGLSFQIGNGTNEATIEFSGSVSAMNAALNGLVFAPKTNYIGSASLTITAYNSGLLGLGLLGSSTTSTVPITVTAPPPVNQAPTVTAPASGTTAEDSPLVFSGSNAITVDDVDSDGSAEQVTLSATGGSLSLSGTSGLTFSAGSATNSSSMIFTGTIAGLKAALNNLVYTPSPLFYGNGQITASIDDLGNTGTGGAKTATATIPIAVTEVNQPPTLSLPTSQTGAQNSSIVFSTSGGDPIVAGDVDANGQPEQVSLNTSVGVLQLATETGLMFVAGGDGTSSMTIQGTLGNINDALNGLALTPTAGYTGAIAVNVAVNDLGNSGSGGALTASGVISVNVVSSLVVTTAGDIVDGDTSSINALLTDPGPDGQISLREAIIACNNTAGTHEIDFDIPGGGPQTISVSTPLPEIVNSVIINATSQPGYSGTPLIGLDGETASFGSIGLSVGTSNCTIKGLAIYGFSGNGIDVLPINANDITIQSNYVGLTQTGVANYNGDGIVLADSADDLIGGTAAALGNVISGNFYDGVHIYGANSIGDIVAGNYIGTNPQGTAAIPNGGMGLFIDGAVGNTIGSSIAGAGNVISGNTSYGIEIGGTSPSDNVIQGNYIGVNALGTGALPNGNDGIYLNAATTTTIGGSDPGQGNVISGNNNAANSADGIWISGGGGNTLQGNYIGIDVSGNAALPNYSDGILIQNSTDNLIGGTIAGAGNVISGNGNYGLEIDGLTSTNNIAQGNYIGTNSVASAGISNGNDGILLDDTTGNTIGGTAAGAGNVIAGNNNAANNADGIWIDTGSANTVQGNFIGTNSSDATGLGNYHYGVEIESSANNVIGGVAAGAGNVIADNAKGVGIWGAGATGNSIRGNLIHGNSTIGIDLNDDGITANTGTTSTTSANGGMNFPVFTSVALTGSTLSVSGYIGTASGQSVFGNAEIDLFKSDNSPANGQGQAYLGTFAANADGTFTASLTVSGLMVGDNITATATDGSGDTSEFSTNAVVMVFNQAPSIIAPGGADAAENVPVRFSTAGGNGISVGDVDADGGIEQVSLSVLSGALTLSQVTGITFINGTVNGTSLLTFTGTISAMNAALDGLLFSPAQDFSGSMQLNITADDLGNTGAGGAQITDATTTITVNPVANTPSITNASTIENTPTSGGLVITPNPLDGAAQGYFQIAGITGGTLFMSDGVTPVTDGQFITFAQGEAGLIFAPTTNSAAVGSFSVQAASSPTSAGLVGNPVNATVTVAPVAHQPTVTNSTTIENLQTTSGLIITPNTLDDPANIWFQITNIVGGSLFQSDGVTPIANGDFISAAQGSAGLKFSPTANSTTPGGFTVQASVSAGIYGLGGNIAQASVTVTTPIAPKISAPPAQTVSADAPLTFSASGGDAIVIKDTGSDGSAEQVTLSAINGTLTLGTTAGITLISGSGSADSSVTISGSLAGINAALDGLTFTPAAHYFGSADIQVIARDVGASGLANSLGAAGDVGISISAIAPSLPIEIGILPINPAPAPAAPLPVPTTAIGNPAAPTSSAIGSSTTDTESSSASAGESSGTQQQPRSQAVTPLVTSVAGIVAAPIIPHGLIAHDAGVQLIVPPRRMSSSDLVLSPDQVISLSRGQSIVLELDNVLPDDQARATGIYDLVNRANRGLSSTALVSMAAGSPLWHELDQMQDQATSQHKMRAIAGAASLASVGVSVMYFMWAVRAGSVLSSLVSSMPAWKLVDPLPILDQMAVKRRRKGGGDGDEEDETLETMVEAANTAV